jgi:hypothetical protein
MDPATDLEQRLNIQTVEHGSLAWVNVERPGTAEMAHLKELYGFH